METFDVFFIHIVEDSGALGNPLGTKDCIHVGSCAPVHVVAMWIQCRVPRWKAHHQLGIFCMIY